MDVTLVKRYRNDDYFQEKNAPVYVYQSGGIPTPGGAVDLSGYYSAAQLNAGQLDNRYYTETEVDAFAVKLTGNQAIAGVKSFSSDIVSSGYNYANGFRTQRESVASISTPAAGWFRVATFAGDRGKMKVTLWTTGGSFVPCDLSLIVNTGWNSATIRTYGTNPSASYWHWARITKNSDSSEYFLEVYFNAAMSLVNATIQYDGGYDTGLLYSGSLPAGDATYLLVTVNTQSYFTLNDKYFVDQSGQVFADRQTSNSVAYVSGYAGAGYKLDYASGKYSLEVDNLTVRNSLRASSFEINKIRATNGSLWVSDAVEALGDMVYDSPGVYLFSIAANYNTLQQNDIVRCQSYNGGSVYSYDYRVINRGTEWVTVEMASGGEVPAGDARASKGRTFVRIGNTVNAARRNSIYMTASDTNNPYLDVLSEVNSSSFAGRTRVRLGNLAGISDAAFGGALSGYGLYSDNVYLKGKLVVGSGLTVEQLATAYNYGKMLYRDPNFVAGYNGITPYNNLGNGSVVLSISTPSDSPNNGTTGRDVAITYTTGVGGATPGFGGFYFGTPTRPNAILVCRFYANLPVGRSLYFGSNPYGTGGSQTWITPTAGAGRYEEYISVIKCGYSGTFSSTHFYYVSGGADSTFTWYVSFATVYDLTSSDVPVNDARVQTVIDGGLITTGSIRVGGATINAGMDGSGSLGSSVRFWGGASYANRATAPFRVTQDGSLTATGVAEIGTAAGQDPEDPAGKLHAVAIKGSNIYEPSINDEDGALFLNTLGYAGGATRFRNTYIGNGKGNVMYQFIGSKNIIKADVVTANHYAEICVSANQTLTTIDRPILVFPAGSTAARTLTLPSQANFSAQFGAGKKAIYFPQITIINKSIYTLTINNDPGSIFVSGTGYKTFALPPKASITIFGDSYYDVSYITWWSSSYGGGGSSSSSDLTLVEAPGTNLQATGVKVAMTAGEALSFGDVLYFRNDGKVWKADANTAAMTPVIGMAISTAAANGSVTVLMSGIARNDSWNWTVGSKIYMGTVAGSIVTTAPSGSGDTVQVLGVATHADRVYFNPSNDTIINA